MRSKKEYCRKAFGTKSKTMLDFKEKNAPKKFLASWERFFLEDCNFNLPNWFLRYFLHLQFQKERRFVVLFRLVGKGQTLHA